MHGAYACDPNDPDKILSYNKSPTFVEKWQAMEQVHLHQKDKCRAIGISNCGVKLLKELEERTAIKPACNQVSFQA